MGIDANTTRVLLSARESGVEFTRTLTLGRQQLMADEVFSDLFHRQPPADAERLWSLLGAKGVDALDASNFEGASILHDLNQPLPPELKKKYDFVYDGGTLEHVFNFPVAIRNAMEAVKIGGHLLLHTPTNNYCGHGFYQFSPELFCRVLSPENGFHIKQMIAVSAFQGSPWYSVLDPAEAKSRVEIRYDRHQVILLVLAQRTHEADIFSTTPQQSDYVSVWQTGQIHGYKDPPFLAKLADSWKGGRLFYAIGARLIALTNSRRLTEAWANRRFSRKLQPNLFRTVDRQ